MDQSVHIGEEIKKVIEDRGLIKAKIAEKLNLTGQGFHSILRRPTINADMLQRISEVLDFDFTAFYRAGEKPVVGHGKTEHITIVITDGEVRDIIKSKATSDKSFDERLTAIEDSLREIIEYQARNSG